MHAVERLPRWFWMALLVGLAACAGLRAPEVDHGGYPPLGRLINIDGRRLHLHCSGRGYPTVILMAGGSAFSVDWALVQSEVARTTRVCSYDRAGLGWSDPGPADETVEQTVADLNQLLRTAGERGPFLLVGASIGGIFIRAYQRAFPQNVTGLVFANTSGRVGLMLPGGGGLLWDLSEEEVQSVYPLTDTDKSPSPSRVESPFDRLPPQLQPVRLWLDQRLWERWDPASEGPATLLSWRREFLREFDEKCSGREYPLGDLPLIVVSSEPQSAPPRTSGVGEPCARDNAAEGLDRLSSNSLYVVAAGSGHEIHLFQPTVLVQALERGVFAIRNGVPL